MRERFRSRFGYDSSALADTKSENILTCQAPTNNVTKDSRSDIFIFRETALILPRFEQTGLSQGYRVRVDVIRLNKQWFRGAHILQYKSICTLLLQRNGLKNFRRVVAVQARVR